MSTPKTSEDVGDFPVTPQRIAGYVGELTQSGQELIQKMSLQVNDVQFERAIQIGYMMACQDYGLPVPNFPDPAKRLGF